MKRNLGVTIIITSLIITFFLWLRLKPLSDPIATFTNWLYLAQICALLGIVLFCGQFVMATKAKWLESIFGGLDKVYKVHHITGAVAFTLLLTHPILQIINVLPNADLAILYLWPDSNLSYDFGQLALYSLAILIIITLYIKLPYHIWKNLHEYMGVPLIFAILHVLLIKSDISRDMVLQVWIWSWCGIALTAYIYKRLLYKYLGTHADYTVTKVIELGQIVEIYLQPLAKAMQHKPGQFIFVTFFSTSISPESHPFSISSAPGSDLLRISVKMLGDYTSRLKDLKPGDKATVYGPFGEFSDRSIIKKNDEIWIAGGIGITPFMSMLQSQAQTSSTKNITLYYCTKTADEAVYDAEIKAVSSITDKIRYIPFCGADRGIITAQIIAQDHANQITDKSIFICGPPIMMQSLSQQFQKMGVKPANIIFEDFSLK